MENFDDQDVNNVLDKIDQKHKAARKYAIFLTVAATLVASIVLIGLIYSIASLKQEETNLQTKIKKEQEELQDLEVQIKDLEVQRAEYIKNIAEKDKSINEVKEINTTNTSAAKKAERIAEVIKVTEKQSVLTDKTPELQKFPIAAESLTSNVNVRSAPNLNSKVIATVNKGDKLTVVGFSGNSDTWGGTTANWAIIQVNETTKGFVFSPLIKVKNSKD